MIATTGVAVGVLATCTVFLYIYAFSNPDPKKCWVVRDLDTAEKTSADVTLRASVMGVDVTEGYPIEMHAIFRLWFVWGFWAHAVFTAASGAILAVMACSMTAYKILGSISFALFFTNQLVWLSFGGIWRFSRAGQVASGDQLDRLAELDDETWSAQQAASAQASGY